MFQKCFHYFAQDGFLEPPQRMLNVSAGKWGNPAFLEQLWSPKSKSPEKLLKGQLPTRHIPCKKKLYDTMISLELHKSRKKRL